MIEPHKISETTLKMVSQPTIFRKDYIAGGNLKSDKEKIRQLRNSIDYQRKVSLKKYNGAVKCFFEKA
jgi:hypothetical protein